MKENKNNLDKALETNLGIMPPIDKKCGLNVAEFREPNFNQATIQKRIDELNIEISDIQMQAFCVKVRRHTAIAEGKYVITRYLTSGVDIEDLQAKIVLRDSLIENLKTEKLR